VTGHIGKHPHGSGNGDGWLSRLWHPLEWRRNRDEERWQQDLDQRLAWKVQDIMYGLGLIQYDFSIGGSRSVHYPEVASVSAGPPVTLNIRILLGQTPDDFDTAKCRKTFAYHLSVAKVEVERLRAPLIRLKLGDPVSPQLSGYCGRNAPRARRDAPNTAA
jgi:hypothetical protein